MTTFFIIIFSYLIGSIPFAYLLVRLDAKKDIRELGTGNIGARNSYDITGNKWLGIAVFILDALKGLAVVHLATTFTNNNFLLISLASVLVIMGHNYSIFMKFKGGRGLSTGVGVFILISPVIIPCWLLMWLFGYYAIKRDIHTGNIIATATTPLFFYVQPDYILRSFTVIEPPSLFLLKMLALIICLIIFIKHIGLLKNLLNKKAD